MLLEKYNIDLVDSELIRKRFAGSYIVKDKKEAAIIEVSTSHSVKKILDRLENLNIKRSDIKYIFVTHIHLDHASGAGNLLQYLPNAKLVVQPSGSKHMVDPSKLIIGANNVYGEDVVKKDYGDIIPIPQDKIIECNDGEIFNIGNRKLVTVYTPGHARHHISIFDSLSNGIFSGDSFGLSYPELDVNGKRFYQPTTTPTAFEYDKMLTSIDKMMSLKPEIIFFTHFGYSDNPLEVERQIKKRLFDYKIIIESKSENLEEEFASYYIKESKAHGSKLKDKDIINLFDIDIKLNIMGLLLWKNRGNM